MSKGGPVQGGCGASSDTKAADRLASRGASVLPLFGEGHTRYRTARDRVRGRGRQRPYGEGTARERVLPCPRRRGIVSNRQEKGSSLWTRRVLRRNGSSLRWGPHGRRRGDERDATAGSQRPGVQVNAVDCEGH